MIFYFQFVCNRFTCNKIIKRLADYRLNIASFILTYVNIIQNTPKYLDRFLGGFWLHILKIQKKNLVKNYHLIIFMTFT